MGVCCLRPAIFLDRDGVLNQAIVRNGRPFPPRSLDDFRILPGVLDALERLREAGYLLIVVTNQPDVARGLIQMEEVERMHSYLASVLPVDDIKVCYHDDIDQCSCRKPLPGSLFSSAKTFAIDLKKSYMVGDRGRDIGAGKAAGCKTIFIDYSYTEHNLEKADYVSTSLLEASKIILNGL